MPKKRASDHRRDLLTDIRLRIWRIPALLTSREAAPWLGGLRVIHKIFLFLDQVVDVAVDIEVKPDSVFLTDEE